MARIITKVLLVLLSPKLTFCEGPPNMVYNNDVRAFPYELTATAIFGRMTEDATPNSMVPVDTTVAKEEEEVTSPGAKYLQLVLWEDLLFYSNSSELNSSDVMLLRNGHVTPRYRRLADNELPPNVIFDLSRLHSTTPTPDVDEPFSINEDKYILIDDDPIFKTAEAIDFWVVAIRRVPGLPDEVVSSPATFVVKIDHEKQQGQGAALYAGVIVAAICIFALLIPFTVRTKRRLREGKPICAWGSSSKAESDSDANDSAPNNRKRSQENLAAILNETERSAEVTGVKRQTIQSQAMMSTSNLHLQPHWRDPHFRSSYERPSHYVNSSHVTHPSNVTYPSGATHSSDMSATGDKGSTDKMEEMPSTSSIHLHKF